MISFEKNNVDSYKLFTLPLTKKLITSECPFLETVQLLFEHFLTLSKINEIFEIMKLADSLCIFYMR